MNLNFINSIISIEALKKANPEIIERAKKKGKQEAYHVRNIKIPHSKIKKALELVNGSLYSNFNNAEKLIIVSNIVFVDDKSFADTIIELGFDEEKIYILNDLINKIRLLKRMNPNVKVEHELLNEFSTICQNYFGISCLNIVINKMNELVVTNPQLFKKQEKNKEKVLALD